MSLRTKLVTCGLMFTFVLFGGSVFGQQQTTQTKNPPTAPPQARRGPMRRAMRRAPIFRVLNQLNLTPEQKEQARSIIQSNLQSTKAQRLELRQLTQQWRQGTVTAEGVARAKELRTQLAEVHKGMRTQLTGILTAEQKAKLEEMIKNRRANHERFGMRKQLPN